jgi:hypothetical protein
VSRVGSFASRHRLSATLAGLLVLYGSPSLGQDVTEVALKAVFVYNFAKFTEWPSDVLPVAAPIVICVIGDPAMGEALERAVKGRLVATHGITVMLVAADRTLPSCHLLYVSGVATKDAGQIATRLRGTPVLTISDIDEFARIGGIAQIFVENGKMRFSINLESAKRAHLQLSSKLLALAALVVSDSRKAGS